MGLFRLKKEKRGTTQTGYSSWVCHFSARLPLGGPLPEGCPVKRPSLTRGWICRDGGVLVTASDSYWVSTGHRRQSRERTQNHEVSQNASSQKMHFSTQHFFFGALHLEIAMDTLTAARNLVKPSGRLVATSRSGKAGRPPMRASRARVASSHSWNPPSNRSRYFFW